MTCNIHHTDMNFIRSALTLGWRWSVHAPCVNKTSFPRSVVASPPLMPQPVAAGARETAQQEPPLKIPRPSSSQQLLHHVPPSAGPEAGAIAVPLAETVTPQVQLQTHLLLHCSVVLVSPGHTMTAKFKWLWWDQHQCRRSWRKEKEEREQLCGWSGGWEFPATSTAGRRRTEWPHWCGHWGIRARSPCPRC